MKKREQGVLTVEASIVLVLMLLFILFIFSFGWVYQAQSLVSHAALQAADAVALESYMRETALQEDAGNMIYKANHMTGANSFSAASLESLRSANLPKIVREKFAAAISGSEDAADAKLRSLGVKDGLSGIDFTQCQMDLSTDDVIVAITYTIKMQFPVFGFEELTITKAAKAKTFGEILFEVTTRPNNPGWGSTGGGNKVPHGSTVEIIATPNYGYKFVGWDDDGDGVVDNTDPNRKVTVVDAQKYVAIFEKDKFGVNLNTRITYDTAVAAIAHTNYGTVSGAGNYAYLETANVSATPSGHYEFVGWDDNGDGRVDNTNANRTITVDKVYNLKAIFKPRTYTIKATVNNTAYGNALATQGSKKGESIQAEYGSTVQLSATVKDTVRYLFQNWSHNSTQSTTTVTVDGDSAYEAVFMPNTYTVTFYNGNSAVHTTSVLRGSSISGSKAYTASAMPGNPSKNGASFDKWTYSSGTFTASTKVNGDTAVYAAWKYTVTLNANGGSISGSGSKSYSVSEGSSFNFSSYTPSRNGFNFNGWYVGGTKYSGSKTINSAVTVTASWSCRHRYDNGSSMYTPVSQVGSGSGCSGTSVTYSCRGCGHSYTTYGSGSHNYSGWCGTKHSCNWKNSYCTRGNHNWSQYGCITCKYCGRLQNGGYYYGAYRSKSCWCIKHNGHSGKTQRITGPHG